MRKRFVQSLLLACLVSHAACAADQASPVTVTLGDITDSRTTGPFFKDLKIEFKLGGDAVFDAYGIGTPVFSAAKDDTGRSLIKEEPPETSLWAFHKRQKKSDTETVEAKLLNPARRASSMTLEGTVPVYVPSRDPAAVISVASLPSAYRRPIESKETGVTLIALDKDNADIMEKARKDAAPNTQGIIGSAMSSLFNSGMSGNALRFLVTDPQNKLVQLEVSSGGKVMDYSSREKTTQDKIDVYTYSYREAIPADATLKIYLATPKSMLAAPFKLENVALP